MATATLTKVQCPTDQFSYGVKYLTKGKVYDVVNIAANGFDIKADTGDIIFCVLQKCAHLKWRNWIIVN